MHFTRQRCRALMAFALAAATLLGCNTGPAKPSLMANMAKDEYTVYQLRAMDYEYASRFAELVAASSAEIVAASEDSVARERALRWRMWAMPEARSAAFDQDPFAGLIELWVLSHQQHHFFTEGDGRDWFGAQQELATGTTLHLQQESDALVARVMSDSAADRTIGAGARWVAENPIEGELAVRPTGRADLAALVPEVQRGGLQAVGGMDETLRDLSDRITILSAQTPVAVRWQAEYLVEALFEERVQERIDSIVDSIDQVSGFFSEFEDTLSAQTRMLLAGVEQERIMVFTALESERQAIVEAVELERTNILDELDRQLAATTAELDAVGRGLIDHFFVRLVEVLVAIGAFILLVVGLVLLASRKRSSRGD
jgi:hypothetical protein